MAGFETSLLELGDLSSRASTKRPPGTLSKMQKKVRSISLGTISVGKARYEQDSASILEEEELIFDQQSERDVYVRETGGKGAGTRVKEGKSGKLTGKSDERVTILAAAERVGPPPGTVELSTATDEGLGVVLVAARAVFISCVFARANCRYILC